MQAAAVMELSPEPLTQLMQLLAWQGSSAGSGAGSSSSSSSACLPDSLVGLVAVRARQLLVELRWGGGN